MQLSYNEFSSYSLENDASSQRLVHADADMLRVDKLSPDI
jgi:hypothetical protein